MPGKETTDEISPPRPLRLWPGVALGALLAIGQYGVPLVEPEAAIYGIMGGLLCSILIVAWWLFFSRAPWLDRLGALVLMAGALFATRQLVHVSIANGAMGMLFIILAVPTTALVFVGWAVAAHRLPIGRRRLTMVGTILLASGGWTLVRTGGFTSYGDNDLAWRWSQTPEERLLATAEATTSGTPVLPAVTAIATTPANWPGFRGPKRDGIVRGVRVATDWSTSPPVELWRRSIGPGWSSFAVQGGVVFTQEQRGDDEIVSCYTLATGEPVWLHSDAARFWESNAGAGPRATPTLSSGRVYTLGATGIFNVLDARDGSVVWSRNAATDTGAELPGWGFSNSPFVIGDVVIAAVSTALVAYDVATGEPRWKSEPRGEGYSSPQLLTIDGVPQILQMTKHGATAVVPADGTTLWVHAWEGYPIVQPAVIAGGDLLISTGDRAGVRRITVARGTDGWAAEERWTSNKLKPYFNDFVIHDGHAYGFDGGILACVDLADAARTWKGGRYGRGQLVLLADQAVLLVLSEQGEVALVAAIPDEFKEIAKFPAITGKTWNHPVLVGDVLLVRNDEEMAAFRLTLAGG